ncbi:uncharacterized protein [Manis javanica]|uniref:uncharacterized protein n=1 Tax=Manis javanica TaxID=9974 RepID=UPI003C6D9C61
MRSCCAEPAEGVGVREAERESLPARCGHWLSNLLQRLCPCLPRSPEPTPEPSVHGTEVPRHRAPRTGVRGKQRKRTTRVEPAPNTSRSTPESTLPPEDADQPTMSQQLPRSWPGSFTGNALTASSSYRGHYKGPEKELKIPRMGQASRLAWEPEHVPSDLHGQPSSTLEGQVLHHLVQEEHLGPTVAELEDPQQMQLAPETKGGLASWLQRVQELFQTPVLKLRLVSPASAPEELEDIPAEASALRQGPKLEPHESSGMGPGATVVMVPGLTEPEPCPDPVSPWDIPGVVSALVPGPKLKPHEPLGLGPMTSAGMAPGLAEPEADPEPTSACVAITRDVWRKEEWTILAFPHGLVAEQLTLICAGLYNRMDFAECNNYLQNQPQMGDTYRVLKEFDDALVKLVTTTCLGTPSMMACDRAEVVRFWIWVAMGSLNLRNYTALHAIVSALQSPAIRRLESTWGHVSCICLMVYEDLKTQDNWVHRKRLFKEMESILRARQWGRMGPEERMTKDLIPYLGLILDDSIDKHLEYEDFAVIQSEITMQRKLAKVYDLEPNECFLSFAKAMEPLDEEESYSLSCQLEPPCQRASRKGQSFRSHKI